MMLRVRLFGVAFVIAILMLEAMQSGDLRGDDSMPHPLDPLAATEIEHTVQLLKERADLSDDLMFPIVSVHEPDKQALLAAEPPARQASVLIMDRKTNTSYEAIVNLTAGKVESLTVVPGIHPLVLLDEYETVEGIVREDARWQAAMRKRGITELEKVYLDCWAPGYVEEDGPQQTRMMRVLSFYQGEGINAYGRPVEGVVATVDVAAGKVTRLLDTGIVPVSQQPGTDFFDVDSLGPPLAPLRPLKITQPDGPSFEIHGQEIRWQQWRFRYLLHPREGLVLLRVGFEDGGQVRPILHRASVAEMVVPYGDPDPAWSWRSAFDQGEYGLGRTANSLQLGLDVPENAVLLDATFADDRGDPYVQPDAVAVYEQDGGLLWKHFDEASGKTAIRRGRQLVVGYVATIGNYDYGLNWIFHQDGSLELRVDLTGILLVKGVVPQKCANCEAAEKATGDVEPQGDQRYGTLVDGSSVATNHQHIFSFRLDFDIDGTGNGVLESTVRKVPFGPDNPAANAFVHVERVLRTEREAERTLNLEEHRRWKVYNPNSRNTLGHYAGYMLHPGENSVPYVGAESSVHKRAGYIDKHLWVTRLKPGENYASGAFPRQRIAEEGLPHWSGDESLEDTDLVMWYTMAVTHVPRAEEWPIMPAAHVGFKLIPAGFFTRNPCLTVPEPPVAAE